VTAYQFAVLQYMPDAARQETVNVGVVVAIPGTSDAEVRMLKKADAARLKWLGVKDDMGFLHDVAEDLAHPRRPPGGTTAADALVLARSEWGGTIRVSELHAALHDDPADLCDELYNRYVANPRTRRPPAYRDRSAVRRTVSTALRKNFPKEAIQPGAKVPGRYEPHRFDLGLANGRLLHAIATMSFEAPAGEAFQTEIDAWAWAITDVRTVDVTLPISVVTFGSGSRLDQAAVMYEALGARLIREAHIEDWSRGVASELGPVFKS
jgi:hypothetical protein